MVKDECEYKRQLFIGNIIMFRKDKRHFITKELVVIATFFFSNENFLIVKEYFKTYGMSLYETTVIAGVGTND